MKNSAKLWSIIPLTICLFWSCNKDHAQEITPPIPDDQLVINIDLNTTYQTMEHFGASDAWSCQFVGNWPTEKKEAIADLLFSLDLDENEKPVGIGLSLWRFNIGAGSAEQGSLSGISDEWRRAESFLGSDGTYNWEKQKGQIWFAKAAKNRSVEKPCKQKMTTVSHNSRLVILKHSSGPSHSMPLLFYMQYLRQRNNKIYSI